MTRANTDGPSSHQDGALPPKVPKPTASVGLGQKLLTTPLPSYSGPYGVGYMDIEVPVREPRPFSHIRRDHKFLLKLETVLFSLYYPCHLLPAQGTLFNEQRKWYKPHWIPHPRFKMARSYGRFMGFPRWPTVAIFASTTMSTKLPAFRNAGLAEHWPPDQDPQAALTELEVPVFPLVIFSHGLGGIDLLCLTLRKFFLMIHRYENHI
jgi:platelet-activating factor acetylhydrolase